MSEHDSGQQWQRAAQDAIDDVRHFCENHHRRLSIHYGRLVESYEEAKTHLLIHFSIGGEQFVAHFQRAFGLTGLESEVHGHGRPTGFVLTDQVRYATNKHALRGPVDSKHEPVLVDHVEFVESPEMVIPSAVRIGREDEIYGVLPHAFYFSACKGIVARGVFADWERDIGRHNICATTNEIELLREMIEGGSKVVQGVPNHEANHRGDGLRALEEVDGLAGLRIFLDTDTIWVATSKLRKSRFQVSDVEFGPVEFE